MWLGLLSSSTILIPIIVGFIKLNITDKPQKYFIGFLLFSLSFEIFTIILAFKNINTMWIFRYFLMADFIFFFWLFRLKITMPKWLNLLLILLILYAIFNEIFLTLAYEPQNKSNYFFVFSLLFSIILSGYVITQIFDNLDINPSEDYLFWIAFAHLFYSLIILFIYVYPNLRSQGFDNKQFNLIFGTINTIGNVLCNIVYTYSFLCKKTIN